MPYKIKITEKPSEETKTQIINELKELRAILEEYKDKTIEVNLKKMPILENDLGISRKLERK